MSFTFKKEHLKIDTVTASYSQFNIQCQLVYFWKQVTLSRDAPATHTMQCNYPKKQNQKHSEIVFETF